ncbi:WD40-repeat-containing domain protein [Mycena olivaceomarginata]|nr:WD40-repeat-containing domain protein [Mycena olivaceomarginata]
MPGPGGKRSQDTILPTFRPSSSSHPEANISDKLKKAWGMAWNGLETALRLLEKSADACPPLKSAVGGLVACLDLTQTVAENREEYEKLATELTSMANTLTPYIDVSGSVVRIIASIEAELTHIGQQQDRGKIMRTVEANQDQGDVIQRYHRIESLFHQLQSDISLRSWQDTRNLRETALLKDMSPVDEARYNSSYSTTIKRRGCTAKTREKILEDLKSWVVDPKGAKVYWMNACASGWRRTGDSAATISAHVSLLHAATVNNIVPTLAYQLARYSPAFRSAVCKVLEEKPEASKLDVKWQFEMLLQEPMQAVESEMPEKTLLKLAVDLPIKFFVTSRPEPTIREKMLTPGYSRSVLHLHDIEESIVEADIKMYLTEALGFMSPTPSPNDVERLAKRAGKLFIYAATTVRYIHHPRGNSSSRLQTVPGMVSGSTKQHDELNRLYTSILSAAVDKSLEEQEMNNILLTLRTVVCAKEPMTVQTLASLLSLTEGQVRFSLEPLRSILHVQDGIHGLVTPFHASFSDYLFDKLRSGDFHCESTEHSEVLANCCFDLMKAQLQFNICKLESSFVLDKDSLDLQKRIKNCISAALSYACRYWGEHLRQGNFTETVHERLVDFLTHRLLFWMENWLRGSVVEQWPSAAIGIWKTDSLVRSVAFSPDGTRITSGSNDKTIRVRDACTGDTVAGPFKGHTDSVQSVSFSRDGTRIVSGSDDETVRVWDARTGDTIARPFKGHTGSVWSVAFSPDGTRIVSASDDKTIRVWDACTGETVAGPFTEHKNCVRSVAFSPNGTHIASGSGDQTIRTVQRAYRFSVVDCILSCIVSGSYDQTIRIWDARTGDTVAGPFKGHTDSVLSVAFSPNGTRIVSGSYDDTIRIGSRRFAFSPDDTYIVSGSDDETIRGHTDSIQAVAFSPDGTCIASGSYDDTIRIWDARTGNTIAAPFTGHKNSVWSIAFSPDGTHIVSGSYDRTVRVWDARTGETITGPFKGHTHSVWSVAFSPDGTHIASSSYDQTIRVWDARTGDTVAGPFKGHTDSVQSVSFSPDGTRIVSGSDDETVQVWDARTGDTITGPFKGHTGSVQSVSFSPDGTHIISGSDDETIRVWDAHTGTTVAGPFKGHTDWVRSVAFSPDGTHIASGSGDQTIRVWDARTGNTVAGPFKGHTDLVWSVAFSPDSTSIVSGSRDQPIRVWDARAGYADATTFTDISVNTSPLSHQAHGDFMSMDNFTFTQDGWITVRNALFFWISPYFRTQLPYPRNTLVIGPEGTTLIDYCHLSIGKTWSECYFS